MTGRDLAKMVAPRYPDTEILLASGYVNRMADADPTASAAASAR